MDPKKREKRLKILEEIREIEINHCDGCQIRADIIGDPAENKKSKTKTINTTKADRYCRLTCKHGKRLGKLGSRLISGKKTKRKQTKGQSFSTQERSEKVEELKKMRANGEKIKNMAAILGVTEPTIHSWINKYIKNGQQV